MVGYSTSGISKPYYTPTPLNDVFILYLLNIQKNNLSKLKNERTNERTKRTKQKNWIDQPLNDVFILYLLNLRKNNLSKS